MVGKGDGSKPWGLKWEDKQLSNKVGLLHFFAVT